MVKRFLLTSLWALLLVTAGLNIACSQNTEPAQLTGEEPHERHATGIESQVNDH